MYIENLFDCDSNGVTFLSNRVSFYVRSNVKYSFDDGRKIRNDQCRRAESENGNEPTRQCYSL